MTVECGGFGGRTPTVRYGGFGAVFKFESADEARALKVFLGEDPMRSLRYRLIAEHLAAARPSTPRMISCSYDEAGIMVGGRRYPTLVMDWTSGMTLDRYVATRLSVGQLDNRLL